MAQKDMSQQMPAFQPAAHTCARSRLPRASLKQLYLIILNETLHLSHGHHSAQGERGRMDGARSQLCFGSRC